MKRWYMLFLLLLLFPKNSFASTTLERVYKIKPTPKCTINYNSDENIRLMNGAYFFNRNNTNYVVYAGIETPENEKNAFLILVDIDKCEVIAKNGEKILGHANDITFNNSRNEFYVTRANYKNEIVRFVISDGNNPQIVFPYDDETGVMTGVTVSSGFDYDISNGKMYIFSGSTLREADIVNETTLSSSSEQILKASIPDYYDSVDFVSENDKDIFFVNKEDNLDGYPKFVNQGIAIGGNNIYLIKALQGALGEKYATKNNGKTIYSAIWLALSNDEKEEVRDRNSAYSYTSGGTWAGAINENGGYNRDSGYIHIYNKRSGEYKYSLYISRYTYRCHYEDLTIIDDKMWIGCNNSYESPSRISFLVYDGISEYEEDFHNISISDYIMNDDTKIISKINSTNQTDLTNKLISNGEYSFYSGGSLTSGSLATGNTLRVTFSKDETDTVDYKLSILGDVLGNGSGVKANARKIAEHLLKGNVLENEYLLAADYNGDNSIKVNDIMNLLNNISD